MYIKFAILGYGHIGSRYRKLIGEHGDCRLQAIIDTDSSAPEKTAGAIPFYNSPEHFFDSEDGKDTSVVVVATPNGLHKEHAVKCLKAGKHIVLEKPFALTGADAKVIVAAAADAKKNIFPVMQNRFSAASQWLKEQSASGRLGELYFVQVNCFWNRDARYYRNGSWHGNAALDGGTLFTQFSHFVDLLYWCFGDITNIQTRFRTFRNCRITDFEDTGTVHFDFLKGGIGSINFSTAVWQANMESSITVIAEKGTLKISGQYMDQISYCNIEAFEFAKDDFLKGPSPAVDNHYYIIDNVVNTLRGNAVSKNDFSEEIAVVDIIERIYKGRVLNVQQKHEKV